MRAWVVLQEEANIENGTAELKYLKEQGQATKSRGLW
jgi:hypothetical protein